MSLKDKVVVVVGGAGDIGGAVVQAALSDAAQVYVLDLAAGQGQDGLSVHPEVFYKGVDLSCPQRCAEVMGEIARKAGRIDALVAASGQLLLAPIEAITADDLARCFSANVYANFFAIQAVLPFMKKSKYGRIVVLSSDQASHGRALGTAYGMTKAAMVQFVKSLTADLRGVGDIRVNALTLGTIAKTRMTMQAARDLAAQDNIQIDEVLTSFSNELPTGQLVDLQRVAAMACYLCSSAATDFAGSVIAMDAGLTAVR